MIVELNRDCREWPFNHEKHRRGLYKTIRPMKATAEDEVDTCQLVSVVEQSCEDFVKADGQLKFVELQQLPALRPAFNHSQSPWAKQPNSMRFSHPLQFQFQSAWSPIRNPLRFSPSNIVSPAETCNLQRADQGRPVVPTGCTKGRKTSFLMRAARNPDCRVDDQPTSLVSSKVNVKNTAGPRSSAG